MCIPSSTMRNLGSWPAPSAHPGSCLFIFQNSAEWGVGTGPALRRSWCPIKLGAHHVLWMATVRAIEVTITHVAGIVCQHMRCSQTTGMQGWSQAGILLLADLLRAGCEQTRQCPFKETPTGQYPPDPACLSAPIVSPGAPASSLLSCILLRYYADILIMQICF